MKIALAASEADLAIEAEAAIRERYDIVSDEEADVIVALGGDGFMLQTLHKHMQTGKPIFGMNRGTFGFLMNEYSPGKLMDRIEAADSFELHPLRMTATTCDQEEVEFLAVNEVSLLRETRQAAKIRVVIDGYVRVTELIGDGVLVSTPAGSTAYNLSANGPIIPLGANLLALTPVAVFRPRGWRGALVPHNVDIEFIVQTPHKRPVAAVADMHEVRDVRRVTVSEAQDVTMTLLFDREHNLAERIFSEQFSH